MADAGTTKITNTRDRMSSQPSKNIDWNAEVKSKPPPPPKPLRMPPPPSRIGSASSQPVTSQSQPKSKGPAPPVPLPRAGSSATSNASRIGSNAPPPPHRSLTSVSPSPPIPGPPPVIRRDTRPDHMPSSSPSPPLPPPTRIRTSIPRIVEQDVQGDVDRIDWANLSPEDKQTLFSWLDEFFARYLDVDVSPRNVQGTVKQVNAGHTPPPMAGPAKVPASSRPRPPPRLASGNLVGPLTSYPPQTQYGSAAEDLAHYFSPSTHWSSAWYASDDMLAPPIRGSKHIVFTAAWESDGTTKTLYGGVIFSDLSMCFYSVAWPQHALPNHDANDSRSVRRSARYTARPGVWTYAQLVEAHETYGETIAGFAESFEGTGQACGRGECWDLANEAIRYFEQYDYVPKPVPSIARTHGHLIYEGKASGKGGTQAGQWRGGDDRVRRGDIIEWRSARVGVGRGSWAVLGNPEHTAVVVSEMVPSVRVADGKAVRLSEMGTVEVMEQSLGKPPARGSYDLSKLEEGEVWIYRPVGMEAYVGSLLVPKCAEGVNALRL